MPKKELSCSPDLNIASVHLQRSTVVVSWRVGRHNLLHRDIVSEGRNLLLRTINLQALT